MSRVLDPEGVHLAALRRTSVGPWRDPPPGERILLRGMNLFPWCASVRIDRQEIATLRSGRPIPRRAIEPPSWSLPQGYPDPPAPLRGIHDHTLVALLRERENELIAAPVLRAPL